MKMHISPICKDSVVRMSKRVIQLVILCRSRYGLSDTIKVHAAVSQFANRKELNEIKEGHS